MAGMTENELSDALDGFFAYDLGATDSGIRDAMLRRKVREYLASMDDVARKTTLTNIVKALEYEPEDLAEFMVWVKTL
jgi:hypothetical protein